MTKQWIKGRLNGKQLRLARRTTTTAAPIACLLEWDPSKCQIFHHKRPLFAPHLAYSKTTHGLITPVLPISGKAEESEESKSSSLALLPTSELALTTSTVTGKPAQTTIAQPEQLEKFSQEQEYHQATVNGEFTVRTHTFISTITNTSTITITTTTTTPTIITIATAHITTITTTDTIIPDTITFTTTTSIFTSTFSSLTQKHDNNNHDIFAIPKTNSNRIMLTPSLFHLNIDGAVDDNNDDDNDGNDGNDDERFAFFWPTISSFRAQTAIISSPEIKNMPAAPTPMTTGIIPAKSFHWYVSTTKAPFYSLTSQNEHRSNENKYGKFTANPTATMNKHFFPLIIRNNISMHEYGSYSDYYSGYHYHLGNNIPEYNYSYLDSKHKSYRYPSSNQNYLQSLGTNPKCYDYLKGKDNNYSNCANATIAISTLSTTSPPLHPSLASTTAPPLPSSSSSSTAIITNKIMQITSAISQQPNRNYFEDLWSDIAGPPAVIVDSDQQESKNKTTRTTSPSSSSIVANLIDSNLSTRPLTFPTLQYTQPPTQKSVSSSSSLHKEAKTPSSEKRLTSTTPKIASFLLNISTKSSLVIDNAEEGRKRIEGPEAKNWGNVNSEHKSQRVLTVPTVPSSTFRHRIRTTLVSHTIYAVRPTTPMGELITDTVKTPAAPTDFPRTALISIASLSVIIIIAIVVFCVFRCRQSGPSTDQYPMVCSGKQSGYAPIPAELSPPMMREPSRQNTAGPFFHNRVNQLDGYQPIKGAVIPNGNNSVNSIKGNCASSTNGRKKEFKEWYV